MVRGKPGSKQEKLYGVVVSRVSYLQSKNIDEEFRHPDVVARLARLRHAVTAEPGAIPEVWADTIGLLPEELLGSGGDPSEWEHAAHTALTLFAVHSQGHRTAHRERVSLGGAVRRLANARDSGGANPDSAVFKRFQALATSTSRFELRHHLRSMVTLLRAEKLQLDYGQLAVDVHDLSIPYIADSVRLRWGRDYHRASSSEDESTHQNSEII